jgi:uncharacterized protein
MEVTWDPNKAATNPRDHDGVTFEQGAIAFSDPLAVEFLDTRENYDEDRYILLGIYQRQVLYIVYTECGDTIRLISVRKATKNEIDYYYRENAK